MKLDVPLYKNFNDDSCFVEVVAMILEYGGNKINRKKVFERAKVFHPKKKGEVFGCTVPSIMMAIKEKGYLMTAWHDLDKKEIKEAGKETELFFKIWGKQIKQAEKLGILKNKTKGKFSLIKKYLKMKIPVIVGVGAKTFYEGNPLWEKSIYNQGDSNDINHVLVVTGYENGKYIYNDSSPFLRKTEGKDMKVSEKRLRKAWKNASYVKNAIFVLEKK